MTAASASCSTEMLLRVLAPVPRLRVPRDTGLDDMATMVWHQPDTARPQGGAEKAPRQGGPSKKMAAALAASPGRRGEFGCLVTARKWASKPF